MKRTNFAYKLTFLATLVLVVGTLIATNLIAVALAGPGVILAIAGATAVTQQTATTDVTKTKSSTLLLSEISKIITKMRPSATPIDTIIRNVGQTVKVGGWETKYYECDYRGIQDQVHTTVNATGGSSPAGTTHQVKVKNVHYWNVDDNLVVNGVPGYSGTGDLVLHITAINTGTKYLTVITVNGTGTYRYDIPEILADTNITRIGNAKTELAAQTAPYMIYPQPLTNYCQIHMAQVEESLYDQLHNKEVNWDINDFRAQSIYDMRLGMELASLFGAKGYKTDGANYYYFSNGIVKSITKTDDYTIGSMGTEDLYSWAKTAFSKNTGSDVRYLFGGGNFIEELNAIEPVVKQQSATNTEVVYGVTFQKIVTNFGVLLVKHHDLFNQIGWDAKGLILDMKNIERHVFKPMDARKLDLIGSGQRNANAYVMDEAFCLITRYPDTHVVISGTN